MRKHDEGEAPTLLFGSVGYSLSLSLSLSLSIEGSNLISRMFFFSFLFLLFLSSTLLSILRMFGMKEKPITRTKEEICQNRHLGRFSTELFNRT